jgi:hypothetical protein
VSKLSSSESAFCLRPEAGTKPAVSYLPPKQPRGL